MAFLSGHHVGGVIAVEPLCRALGALCAAFVYGLFIRAQFLGPRQGELRGNTSVLVRGCLPTVSSVDGLCWESKETYALCCLDMTHGRDMSGGCICRS